MTRVVLIDGAPGAGKTRTLSERLEDEAQQGLQLSDFYWLNFTNSGREDVEPEIEDVYPDTDSDIEPTDRAKTVHGLALSLAIMEGEIDPNNVSDQIIVQGNFHGDEVDPYADFCRRQGMTYDPDYSDPRKLLSGVSESTNTGNLLFAINDYLTQTCKPPEKWRSTSVDIPINGDNVVALLEAWDEYKRDPPHVDMRLFEHGDYVALAADSGLVPPVDVLFIDEFQDLAPLEYRLYKLWRDSGELDRLYIAGDPNQSIYSFRGGTPYYFDRTDSDEQIELKDSYRCPDEIASVGRAVLAAHTDTDPRGFGGVDTGGTVQWQSLRNKYDLRDGVIEATEAADDTPSVLLLTRTNYQLRQLTNDLRDVGVPFEMLGSYGGIWRGDLERMLGVLNGMVSGAEVFAYENVRTVWNNLPEDIDAQANPLADTLDHDAVDRIFGRYDSAEEIITRLELPAWKRDVLKNALRAPAAMQSEEVRVGTIHTAKGLEAPTVYLFTTSSDSMVTRYSRSTKQAAEEHRVYYVGATRASEELNLVDSYFDGPTAPPIEKIRRNQEVIA
ncbi:3'-5' exonuclease [Natrialba aegyptia]|uniref:3'-5' exonuclease n=1 Tax=Natrialba aegyptia TaxID=129789 RepID=UPI00403AA4FB